MLIRGQAMYSHSIGHRKTRYQSNWYKLDEHICSNWIEIKHGIINTQKLHYKSVFSDMLRNMDIYS